MNAKNIAAIGKHAYFRAYTVGGKRYSNEVEEFVQLSAPEAASTYDSSLAIILLENAADAFEQANKDAEVCTYFPL